MVEKYLSSDWILIIQKGETGDGKKIARKIINSEKTFFWKKQWETKTLAADINLPKN